MNRFFFLATVLLFCGQLLAQQGLPSYYKHDKKLDAQLAAIAREAQLDSVFDAGEDGPETISFAVIDFTGKKPVFGGVHADNLIYPASVYKMYVAMEILKQISEGKYSLFTPYVVHAPNDADRARELDFDPRPVLQAGDTVTINYLLDLMITRSDNSAANCLIDVARRENINATIHSFNWQGSEVTRKFVKRKFEDPGYDTIRGTETCALHAADFMYRIATQQLVNPWVSRQMEVLLGRQLDTTKLATGLPRNAMFYHKTGWWSMYTNDVGYVKTDKLKYVIALFTPVWEDRARVRMKEVAEKVQALMEKRHR